MDNKINEIKLASKYVNRLYTTYINNNIVLYSNLLITYLVTSCVKEKFMAVSHSHHLVHHSRSPIHSNNQKNNNNV